MNSTVFARKAAVTAAAALLVLGAPFVTLADQTVTVTLSSSASVSPAQTTQNPIPITATFSEPVTSFNVGNVTVTNGSAVNVVASSTNADVYTFGIAPTTSGSTTVSIAANSVTASADPVHTNQASNQLEFVADLGTGTASTTASSTQAVLTLDNSSGIPGTIFNAIGTDFAIGESVNVGFDGATSTVTADGSGGFTTPLTAGTDQSGPSQITAIGATSGLVATNSFFVEPASTTATTTTGATTSGIDSPSLSVTSGPSNDSFTNQQSVTFGFATDPTATTVCSFDVSSNTNPSSFACGSPVTLGSTTSSTTLPLGDGQYSFTVTATNSAGTGSTTVSRVFTVDTVAPVVTEVTPVANPNDGTAAQYTFTSTKAGTINLANGCSTSDTAAVGTTTITFSTLASGTYDCTLSVTDAAGNVSNTLTLAPFTVNAPAAPVTTSSGGGGGGGGGGGVVLSGPLSIGYVNNTQNPGTTAPATPQGGGQVLGASTYNFTQSLSIGSTGQDVTQLQMVLIAGGFLSIASPTGYYGPLTAAAVSAYQLAHGLPQVGVVGPMTRAILNQGSTTTTNTSGQVKGASTYNFSTSLTVGSSGPDVTALQNALTTAGDYTGPVTGYFGPLTQAAVKTYQKAHGLQQVGNVGPLTRAALNKGQ